MKIAGSNCVWRSGFAALLAAFSLGTPVIAENCNVTYRIKTGDTLSSIAENALGSVFAFDSILQANQERISNPNLIYVGDELWLPCPPDAGAGISWTVMPGPDAVHALQQQTDMQIIDIREEGKGLVSGSIRIPYHQFRGPEDNPGAPPSAERLAEILSNAGVRLDRPTLVVSEASTIYGTGRAAYVYWILKSVGVEELAILRGGFEAWAAADLPVAASPTPTQKTDLDITFDPRWRADELDVYGIATEQFAGTLLDARPHNVFRRFSQAGAAVPSTLPGASNIPALSVTEVLAGKISPVEGVEAVLAHLKAHSPQLGQERVVSFCTNGELGALNWFYASELARIENVQLYPESAIGWEAVGGNLAVGGDESRPATHQLASR